MVAVAVSIGLCFEFYEHRALGQAQEFVELLCNSDNLEAETYNVKNFTAPWTRPKTNIIPTSKLISCQYGILWHLWSRQNVEDCHLEFDEWYKKHTKTYKIQALENQEDPLCHGVPECAPSWTSNEAFGNVFGSHNIPTCMKCAYELTPDSDTYKSMVASSTTMETVKQVKLYLDTCASHMYTPFKEDFVTMNEDHQPKATR